MNTPTVSFDLGQVLFSAMVNHSITTDSTFSQFVMNSLSRHKTGDWGEIVSDDKILNNEALITGGRVFSSYTLSIPSISSDKVWIITEGIDLDGDRRSTTILFPSEY